MVDKSIVRQMGKVGGVDNYPKIGSFTTKIEVWGRVLTRYHEVGYK